MKSINKSLSMRLLSVIAVCTLTPLIITIVLSYVVYNNYVYHDTMQSNTNRVKLVSQYIDNSIDNIGLNVENFLTQNLSSVFKKTVDKYGSDISFNKHGRLIKCECTNRSCRSRPNPW